LFIEFVYFFLCSILLIFLLLGKVLTNDFGACKAVPDQLRWDPPTMPKKEEHKVNFIESLFTVCGVGDPSVKSGVSIYMYTANVSMKDSDTSFYSADGDFLIVPQEGDLDIFTEFGKIYVCPGEICVIQRGIQFSVNLGLEKAPIRGYIVEVFAGHFKIPDLGPIGANGLANPRDFETPVAWYENRLCDFTVVSKFQGNLFQHKRDHSPFNTVAWHGNYVPYKYDLSLFVVINSVSVDHIDPCIFTVLTCPTTEPGVAVLDFAIFPPRWAVAEDTFRPPYYHRNCMSEYMGLIKGTYEAKEGGFVPGGGSLHSCMTAHGPDGPSFEKASSADLKPVRIQENDLSFMFESTYLFRLPEHSIKQNVQSDYWKCWQGLKSNFDSS